MRDVCALETQQWSLLMITKPCVTSRRMPRPCSKGCTRVCARACYSFNPPPPPTTATNGNTPDHAAAVPNSVLREIAFGKLKRVSRCNCRKLTFFKIPLYAHRARRPPPPLPPPLYDTRAPATWNTCVFPVHTGLWDKSLKGIQ